MASSSKQRSMSPLRNVSLNHCSSPDVKVGSTTYEQLMCSARLLL